MFRRARSRARGLAIAGFLAGVGAAAACLPELEPAWLIGGATILALELEVVENGPLSAPLADDPPGARRTDALPGDRLRIAAVVVDRGGRVEPGDAPIILRCDHRCLSHALASELTPPCGEDPEAPDRLGLCRVDGDELVVPAIDGGDGGRWSALWIAPRPESGLGSEECLARLVERGAMEACLFAETDLLFGSQREVYELLGWPDPEARSSERNHAAPLERLDLEIDGDAGTRLVSVAPGERVDLDPGDRVALTATPPAAAMEEEDQRIIQWFADARVFSGGAELRGLRQELVAPPKAGPFEVHVVVHDRPWSSSWATFGFDVGDPGGG